MTVGLPLMKSVLTPLTKIFFLPSGLSVGMSAADTATQKILHGLGHPSDLGLCTTVLIILNYEMEDIMKIVKSLGELRLLIKGISETIKNETKEEKGGFLMLLGTLAASILGNALVGIVVIRAGEDTIRGGEGSFRAGEIFNATPSFN